MSGLHSGSRNQSVRRRELVRWMEAERQGQGRRGEERARARAKASARASVPVEYG